jgi:hypothetical protein
MIGALQTQKKVIELKENSLKAEILVITMDTTGFSLGSFSKELDILKIGELSFREKARNGEELASGFEHLAEEFGLRHSNFQSIKITWPGKNFTLIPNSFYKAERAREILEFNIGNINDERICVNDVKSDIKLLFTIPSELKNVIDKTFPHHELKHSGTCTINSFFTHFQLKKANIFLNIHDDKIELLVKKDKQLLLYNIFSVKTNEDVLYYLLFAVEQFKLDPSNLQLTVCANRETNDELFTTLKKYVRHIDFAVSDKIIKRKDVFETLPQHYYFSLLNQPLCE